MLNIRIQKLGDTTILHCVGRVAFPYAATLQTIALQETHLARLVLDLANATGMDAAGLGVLVSLQSWAARSGRTLKLMNVNPKVQRLLELTNLKSAFEICSAQEMLDLLCRALHAPEREAFVPPLEDFSYAGQLLSPA